MRAAKLGDVMVNAGFNRAEMEAGAAAMKFLESGGTEERWIAVYRATAERMSGRGQIYGAGEGRLLSAPTRQPVEDGGANVRLPDSGLASSASPSSSNRGGEGRPPHAQVRQPLGALPVREPKPQRAAIDFGAASLAIKTKLAQTVLDRVQTNDGRAWGDVKYYELDHMGRDGALAQALRNHIGVLTNNPQYCMPIRDLVNAETFEAIRSKVNGA
jgi:hypothetical protein